MIKTAIRIPSAIQLHILEYSGFCPRYGSAVYGKAVSFDAKRRSFDAERPSVVREQSSLRSGCEPFGSRANLRPSVAAELRSGCEPFGSRANLRPSVAAELRSGCSRRCHTYDNHKLDTCAKCDDFLCEQNGTSYGYLATLTL